MRKLLISAVILVLFTLIAGCAPKEGTKVTIPNDTKAFQVKYNRSALETCTLPSQEVTVTRNTYWESSMGSAGATRINISQVSVSNYGSCDNMKSVFISDETLNDLIK